MGNDNIIPEVSKRICTHMNADHKDALKDYARFYGRCSNPVEVEMVLINSKLMRLLVDGRNFDIHFDHILKDSNDAHQTLIRLIKEIPR